MSYIHLNDMAFIESLETNKETFTAIITNYTYRVKTRFGNYIYSADHVPARDLFFMHAVKKNIESNKEKAKDIERGIHFYYFSDRIKEFKKGNKKGLYEVDLRSAYWEVAHRLGFISADIYKRGIEIDKKLRLKALGAIAIRKIVREYVKGVVEKEEIVQDEQLVKCWVNIVITVSDLMKSLVDHSVIGNDFLFFWVDALFCTEKSKDLVCKIFEENKFNYSVKELEEIEYTWPSNSSIPIMLVTEKGKKPRPFPILENKYKFFKLGI